MANKCCLRPPQSGWTRSDPGQCPTFKIVISNERHFFRTSNLVKLHWYVYTPLRFHITFDAINQIICKRLIDNQLFQEFKSFRQFFSTAHFCLVRALTAENLEPVQPLVLKNALGPTLQTARRKAI